MMKNIQKRIENKLTEHLNPSYLEVVNQSHDHIGHLGDNGSGESHFSICISSDRFSNISSLERQRLIYDILTDEMKFIHALSIKIKNV